MAANLYLYRHGGFPPASKYLDKIWQDRNHKKHKKRLKNVKGQLDLTPPRNNMHLQIQLNKLHMEQERQAAIDKQNLVIIEKLAEIKKSPGRIDNVNKNWKPSNDRLKKFRERRQRRIEQENRLLAERLKKVHSYYDTEEWEKDYKKHLYYMSMMESTTKDYDFVEYKDEEPEKSSERNSSEGEDGEDDETDSLPPVPPGTPEKDKKHKKSSDDEDDISLPPIDDKQKKKKDDHKDEEYSEQDAIMDAEELRAAIKDDNKDKILEILGRTSEREKLQELRDKYQEMYDKDLLEELKPSLDEEAQSVLQSLSSSAAHEDARRLNEAMKGLGTDEDTLIEILCTRNNKELELIRKEYNKQFDRSLEEDLKGDTSGDVEKILVELSKGQREETDDLNKNLAKRDAEDLIEAGVGSWGTDEGEFIRIFTQRSLPQLAAMYPEYHKLAKLDIEESIDKEMDGDLQKTFLTLVKHSRSPSGAREDKINKAVKDGDTETVARIILPMNKAQLDKLCSAYKKSNKASLADDVDKNCSGDLKQMLFAKLGKEAGEKKKENKKGKKVNKGKSKEEEKLPAIVKKKEQEKKSEKKHEKKSETAKEEDDMCRKDVKELHQAIQDNNKDKIVDILSKNIFDNSKLQKLQEEYRKEHQQELLEAIKSVVDDVDLQDPLECLFGSAPVYEARCLYEATKGIGTDEDLLIEILCTRSGSELADIQEAYRKKYGTTLEDDIKSDTSGDFEDLLLELLKGSRDDTDKVDKAQAKKDAEALYQAGAKKFGTDEKTFISVLTKRNPTQLNATFVEYKKLAKVEIEESIEKEMSGDLEKGLVILVKCMRNPSQFTSNKLHSSIQDGDTNTAARLILTSDKAKLTETMNEYKKTNKTSLEVDVQKKCSERLKKLLMAKMGKGKESPQHKKGNQPGKGKDGPKEKGKPSPARQTSLGKKQVEATKGKKEDETSQLYQAIQDEDKKKIKEIIVRHASDKPKLKKLSDDYRKQHNQHLVEALKSNIEDDLHEAITVLLLPPSQADARRLHSAMEGVGTNEEILVEILCSRNNAEIQNIKKDYKKQYSKSLEEDVKAETSGDFKKLLLALLQCQRDESTSVNDDQAHKDAETLIEAGIKSWGTDEDQFIDIFTTRSIPQLQAMLPEYSKWAKCDIEESITSEMDGDLQAGLLTLVACIRDPVKNHVDKIHTAIHDGDTGTVARIVAGSNEASLRELELTYNTNYTPKLFNEVDKKCSPELKKILLPKLKDKNQEKTTNKAKAAEPKKQSGASPTKKKEEKEKEKEKQDGFTQLHAAVEKKDKKKIKEIVLRHAVDKNKIKKLSEDYQQRYDKNLVDELDSKMEDDLHEAITAMVLPPYQADARTLFYAMKGIGTKENLLIEILCTRSNEELTDIKSEYMKKYGRSLEEDVKGDTSDDFEKLLTELLRGARDESTDLDEELVEKDATELYNAGVKIWGTNEEKFIEILTTRSSTHLKAMMAEYTKLSGVGLEESIKDEMDGDLQDGLIMLLSCIQDESKAMADQLYMALQDHDTMTVARIIAATEQDIMTDIETSYNLHHRPKIYSEVNEKCSEDLKKIILPKLKDKKLEKEKLVPPQKVGARKQSIVVKKHPSKNTAAAAAATAAASKEKGEDCSLLYRAIKNNEKKKITEIVVRNATDKSKMQKLSEDYSDRYKKNLVDELDSKLEDDIHEAMTAMLLPPFQASARSLYYAMKGIGNHELHLIEVLCTKSNAEMIEIKKEYQKKYGRSLEEDVKYQTSGDFENLLTALIKGIRDDSTKVNQELAREDATELYNAGVKKWGTDEDKFIDILTTRSRTHLKAMMAEYTKLSGVGLEESIKDEMDGDLQDGLIMLLSCIQDESKGMADQLYMALQDHDTMTVARIIAATEQDKLSAIESSYNSIHQQSLYKEVDKTCSDDLKKIILPKLEADDNKKKDPPNDRSTKISKGGRGRGSVKSNSKQSENSENKTKEEKLEESNKKESKKERPKLNVEKVKYHGTVAADKNFDALRSAERLKKAMKGFGSDEDAIIGVLTSCTTLQRQEVAEAFREQYGQDLVDELKSELSGTFEDAIVGLMSTPAVYDANMLYSAMKGIGTEESVLTEIICSRSNTEIKEIKEAYKSAYGKDVIKDVQDETSGDFRSVLIALLQGKRGSSDNIDEEEAYKDAQRLQEAGEKKWGTDESVFIDILTKKSPMQLRAVFQAYKHVSNKEILESVDEELGGDFHDAVRTIVLCASDPPKYFAECLHSAMNGMMTSHSTVTRIIITRSETDLMEIESAYNQQFGKTLESDVRDTLKGDQERLLLRILGD